MRFNFKRKGSDPWAAIFLPYGESKFKLFAQSNRNGQCLHANTFIHSNRYFPSYCYYYDDPQKVHIPDDIDISEREKYIKKRLIFDNMVLMQKGFKKINDENCLNIQSGLGKCLKYQNQKIGILLLGAKRKNYFRPTDVKPISIISHKITSVIVHYKDYCPWHKMGWRDQSNMSIVRETRFSFSPKAYLNDFSQKVYVGINGDFERQYNELIKALDSFTIKSVKLSGTFNGWNRDQLFLNKVGEGVWETYLYLPLGYYEYRYFVEFESG